MNLHNKTILLTGASGGIGQALAHALAEKGANLYLVGRNEQAMQRLQQQLPPSRTALHRSDENLFRD
nr:SDR family NAD(P)-dependent oxidoreductase [Pectobacterium colocasium]